MPIVGKLIVRHNPKYLLTFGIVVCAFSTWAMSRFSLGADFSSLMWPRIYLGIGMGFLFIPLTTLTLSSIPRPQMGNATSIYNLLRNLGGSFGVAFATTMFVRRSQIHQSRLTEHLTYLDRSFTSAVEGGKAFLAQRGVPDAAALPAALQAIYAQAVRQATALGFNDAFFVLSLLMACILPLVFLIRRPAHQEHPPPSGQ
jgi:DHA2 family multidrug resistance protein